MTQLQYISFILLALYFVGIMVVVLRAKKSTSSEDYFLASRKLPFWALSITFIASWWGGGSAIDLVDQGFNQGISSINAYNLLSKNVTTKVSSGASISVHASESIDGKASSGGSISFEGNPEKIIRKTSSGGSISGS